MYPPIWYYGSSSWYTQYLRDNYISPKGPELRCAILYNSIQRYAPTESKIEFKFYSFYGVLVSKLIKERSLESRLVQIRDILTSESYKIERQSKLLYRKSSSFSWISNSKDFLISTTLYATMYSTLFMKSMKLSLCCSIMGWQG